MPNNNRHFQQRGGVKISALNEVGVYVPIRQFTIEDLFHLADRSILSVLSDSSLYSIVFNLDWSKIPKQIRIRSQHIAENGSPLTARQRRDSPSNVDVGANLTAVCIKCTFADTTSHDIRGFNGSRKMTSTEQDIENEARIQHKIYQNMQCVSGETFTPDVIGSTTMTKSEFENFIRLVDPSHPRPMRTLLTEMYKAIGTRSINLLVMELLPDMQPLIHLAQISGTNYTRKSLNVAANMACLALKSHIVSCDMHEGNIAAFTEPAKIRTMLFDFGRAYDLDIADDIERIINKCDTVLRAQRPDKSKFLSTMLTRFEIIAPAQHASAAATASSSMPPSGSTSPREHNNHIIEQIKTKLRANISEIMCDDKRCTRYVVTDTNPATSIYPHLHKLLLTVGFIDFVYYSGTTMVCKQILDTVYCNEFKGFYFSFDKYCEMYYKDRHPNSVYSRQIENFDIILGDMKQLLKVCPVVGEIDQPIRLSDGYIIPSRAVVTYRNIPPPTVSGFAASAFGAAAAAAAQLPHEAVVSEQKMPSPRLSPKKGKSKSNKTGSHNSGSNGGKRRTRKRRLNRRNKKSHVTI
jgi:hypothetical protein